jgi:hypothetical protein
MNTYIINWLDERMEPHTMSVAAETEALAIEVWEEETEDDFCSEMTEINLWEETL